MSRQLLLLKKKMQAMWESVQARENALSHEVLQRNESFGWEEHLELCSQYFYGEEYSLPFHEYFQQRISSWLFFNQLKIYILY